MSKRSKGKSHGDQPSRHPRPGGGKGGGAGLTQAQTDALKTVADDKLAMTKKEDRKRLVKDVAKECTKRKKKKKKKKSSGSDSDSDSGSDYLCGSASCCSCSGSCPCGANNSLYRFPAIS